METNIIKQYNDCIHHIEFYRKNKDGNMFDSFYHSHLDFMQKSLEYMIKHETVLEVQTEEICPHCKARLNYRVFKDKRYVEEYGYHKGALELRIALCSKCGEELRIPSIEETNKKIVKPYKEREEKERYARMDIGIPTFDDQTPLDLNGMGENSNIKIESETENESVEATSSDKENIQVIPNIILSNSKVFEVLIQPNKDNLEYSDNLANELQIEKESIYKIVEDGPEYVKNFTKFPVYMINEMIEINPEIVLYLKESDFEIVLQGLEYSKRRYYSKQMKAIMEHIRKTDSYSAKLAVIYGEDWENKFNKGLSFPEKVTESVEGK